MTLAERLRRFGPVALVAVLIITGLVPSAGYAQQRRTTASRRAAQPKPQSPFSQGYLKGYNDGFAQGEVDWSRNAPRDFHQSDRWQQRDATASEEYRQGYELGFELAYSDGYYGRGRNTVVPRNAETLARAAALADRQRAQRDSPEPDRGQRDSDRPQRDTSRSRPPVLAPVNVPNGTELRIRLSTPISTKSGRVGDTFRATVVSPASYESSTVDGHIATLNKSGRVSGKTEVGLAFDTLTLQDGRQTRIDADLVKVYESENVKKVDEEGRIETGSRTKDSEVRGGVGAAAGAILGGILGGGKGAVIGLILGGAAGVGSVYVEGNKDLILEPGTEMVIRTVRKER
jgi:outer membrane lipoprotein SlyB